MDKISLGVVSIGILAVLLGFGWLLNKDGIMSASIVGIIGLIAGSIFGFTIAKKEIKTNEENKDVRGSGET